MRRLCTSDVHNRRPDAKPRQHGAMTDEQVDAARPGGWRLLGRSVREQWRPVLLGVLVGLFWTVCKVSVPQLAQFAIDQGLVDHDSAALRKWAALVLLAGVLAATASGARRWLAFRVAR